VPYYKTDFAGLWVFEPKVFADDRGYFFESFNLRDFEAATGQRPEFVQDNQSKSNYGVVRGLHFQVGDQAQAKLVRVLSGAVVDVAVDLRPHSPTYGRSFALELSASNHRQLFIPRGFAHGFSVISPSAEFFYKCDNYYSVQHEAGIAPDDPALAIDWGIPRDQWVLSGKDQKHPKLAQWAGAAIG
jgi:dTDP-4-dehydrorhamnose 3,5-epimerase